MEPKPIIKPTDLQKNINTVLLSLCLMGITWVLKEVNDLQVTAATQGVTVQSNTQAISDIRRTANDEGVIMQKMDIRLSRVETIQDESNQKHKN